MFLDLSGFSKMSEDERASHVEILRSVARAVIGPERPIILNTWGDAIVAAFYDLQKALVSACKFVRHLGVEGIDARVGVNWGPVRLRRNELIERLDFDGDSVNFGARLEPLARPGEVLVSETVRFHPELDDAFFTFTERTEQLKKAVGEYQAGDSIKVYSTSLRAND